MRGVFENTFQNGLSSDYSVVLQPDGTYRYMKNCQLISQDGNNFVVKDCLGNVLTFTINAPYNAVYTVVGTLPKILAMISFPNKLIVFSTNSVSGGYMEIGKLEYMPYGEGVQPKFTSGQYNLGYIPLYHNINLRGNQLHKIKGFSFIENELIERVYWTDNYNEPRVFNVSDPIFTTYIASGDIVNGTSYMVLEGAITYNGVNYGPGLTAGNTFTGTATLIYTNLTGTAPTPKVIVNYPYQLLDFTPSRSLGNITFTRYGGGSLYCGSKVYFYRLGANSGAVTTWSYGSSPVPVGAINASNALTSPSNLYHDFVGGGIENELLISNLSTFITIENIDTAFDYIELACAEFDQIINQPRLISIVNRTDITSSTMTLQHTGSVNLGTLTIGEITLFPASILKVKTLATNKNFILAGNITEREEFDINLTSVSAAALQYPMNSHMDASSCTLSGMIYSGVSPISGANPAAGSVTPFSRWVVKSGTAIYNGNNYTPTDGNNIIIGVTGAGNDSIDTTTNPGTTVRPCVVKNRYTTSGGANRYNFIELLGTSDPQNTCFWDYKSAVAHHHVGGYWSGETYRFGILFFDLKGNPFYVKWLTDYTFPSAISKNGILRKDEIGNTGQFVYSLNPSGIIFDGITIPPSIILKISGFSIVRAERDGAIVAQGLVTQCVHSAGSPDVIRPAAWNPPTFSNEAIKDKAYTFICPDVLVDVPLKKEIGIAGDIMQEAQWLESYDYGGATVVRGAGGVAGSEQVYTKMLDFLDDGSIRTGTITYFGTVNEAASLTNLGGGVSFDNGNMTTSVVGANVIGACVPGAANYALNGFTVTGGKKSFFQMSADFKHYGPSANDYTSVAAGGQSEKILMNYTKAGFSDPYGGTGDGAKANTLYISTGHFQPITATVKSETFDGTNYVFNNVEVFGGDCYTCLIDYGYSLWDNTFPNTLSFAWTFPCECNSNYNLRRGRKTSNVEMYYTGAVGLPNALTFLGPSGEVRLEDFSYNQGYSTEGQQVVYPALPVGFINSNQFQARIRYAGEKFSGETIDSFRTFASADFKDLSYNYGRINDINVKDDKVIVWQDDAISTVPILERQVVAGQSGDATTIGTGGVVDRFDVISSFFGTQHQWSITPTEYGFAWFDMKRKAFVILDFGGGLLEVSQIYGLKAFFDEAFVEVEGSTIANPNILLNSPTFADTSDAPLTGIGIISVFDPKFKMTYMTFKFFGQISTGNKSKDFTIGYLHTNTKKCMVGFFDMLPYHMHNHNGIVLMCNDPKNLDQYLVQVPTGKSFPVGQTLWGASTNRQNEYICIQDVTLDGAAKFPEGGSGSSYWRLINKVNQVWVLNQPNDLTATTAPDYMYNKFFSRVVDNVIHIVINPKISDEESMEVQHISQNTPTNVNYTTVTVRAGSQVGQDVNISSTNRFYRFIRNMILFVPPRSTTKDRITSNYLLVEFLKKNWTSEPDVITKSVKILRSITSVFNTKK